MSKKLAIALTVVLLALVAWVLLSGNNSFSLLVDGKPVTGPFKGVIGVAGMLSALIAAFCAAIILLFVLAGAGVIVLGCLLFAGMILAFVSFPFLLPLLIPLAIVWLFIAIVRHAFH